MRAVSCLVVLSLLSCVFAQVCDPSQRNDCGYVGINQQQCEAQGCCWSPVDPNPSNLPWCYQKASAPIFYSLQSIQKLDNGYQATLVLNNSGTTPYGAPISPLQMTVNFDTADRVHIKFTDPKNSRWEIPTSIFPTPLAANEGSFGPTNYVFTWNPSPFSFVVSRASGEIIFDSSAGAFMYTNQFLQVVTSTAQNPNIYGLGEHRVPFKLPTDTHTYTMWSRDSPTPVDQNAYGSHPFYMEVRTSGAHGVFLKNSNGLDVIVSSGQVTFRSIGGVLDLYVFVGPDPEQVTQQYHQVVGFPHMPPFWALGWHQCRYGYPNIQTVEQVVQNYSAAQIPLDTIWTDIDHMSQYEDFTWDPVNYPQSQVASFVQQLHANNQQYVVIVDPGIHIRKGYPAYDQGVSNNLFIKQSDGKTDFTGVVWPGSTVFPDWFNPKTQAWWTNQISGFLSGVPLDGLWIDMNEASNFQNGQPTSSSPYNNPPYAINNCGNRAALNVKTTSMDCVHYNNISEYDVHNLFGFMEGIATRTALETFYNKRSFVLSRSTFSGSGAHVAHWTGDNFSDWPSLVSSIRDILAFNLFGVPLVGADICGFLGDTNLELCTRWSALGAFYPFARNHNDIHSAPQEPYRWPQVADVSRRMLGARYSLLPYYYTLFFQAHSNGGTVARPLFFEFPTDTNTYAIDGQFLIGPGLMISPVLTQGATTVSVYFPSANWYSWWNYAPQTQLGWQTMNSPVTDLQVHILGGVTIPTQKPALTSAATRVNPYTLLVALDKNGNSDGYLYIDDGQSLNVGSQSVYAEFKTTNGVIASTVSSSNYGPVPVIDQIVVLGVQSAVSSVKVTTNTGTAPHAFTYDASLKLLTISPGLNLSPSQTFTVTYA